ncbi:unnamed protein product [Bathycoccus prasinos]
MHAFYIGTWCRSTLHWKESLATAATNPFFSYLSLSSHAIKPPITSILIFFAHASSVDMCLYHLSKLGLPSKTFSHPKYFGNKWVINTKVGNNAASAVDGLSPHKYGPGSNPPTVFSITSNNRSISLICSALTSGDIGPRYMHP